MRKITTGLAVIGFLLATSMTLKATTEYQPLLISEVQLASENSASEEFVEIYNPNSEEVSLEGLVVQYKSANGASWTTKASLEGLIPVRGRILVSSYHEDAQSVLKSGFSNTSGHIRLGVNTETEFLIDDFVSWGAADSPEVVSAIASQKGESLKRLTDEDGKLQDINNNSLDWFVSIEPSPSYDSLIQIVSSEAPDDAAVEEEAPFEEEAEVEELLEQEVVEEVEEGEEEEIAETNNPDLGSVEEPAVFNASGIALKITELFIDPGTPGLDSEDEFVELFNAGENALNLDGFTLESGDTYRYSYDLPAITIEPGQYLAFYSIDTNLTLSNSKGRARLLDPNQDTLFETDPYEDAKVDTSWVLRNQSWAWTATATPNAPNEVAVSATASEARKVLAASKKSATATSTTKASASKSATSATEDKERDVYYEPEKEEIKPVNKSLLAGVGSLAVLYAGYEYRADFRNSIHRLRQVSSTWFSRRQES